MDQSPLDQYRTVLAVIEAEVGTITGNELHRSTPCGDWDLAALVGHVLGAIRYYASLARDAQVPARPVKVDVARDDDLAARVAAEGRAGLTAWSAPEALDRTVMMVLGPVRGADALAIHVADLTVHAWDVAAARGRGLELPSDLATSALATWERVLAAHDLRGIAFADPTPAPDRASPTERLVAFCGRVVPPPGPRDQT